MSRAQQGGGTKVISARGDVVVLPGDEQRPLGGRQRGGEQAVRLPLARLAPVAPPAAGLRPLVATRNEAGRARGWYEAVPGILVTVTCRAMRLGWCRAS